LEGHSYGLFRAPDLSGMPLKYLDFADVFLEQEAFSLPLHRDFNLKIKTLEGKVPLISYIYSLLQNELSALHDFLDQNLKLGFIYPSHSSHGGPILFAKKKDSSLRLCADYYRLNQMRLTGFKKPSNVCNICFFLPP
jgi:hypothetical protein